MDISKKMVEVARKRYGALGNVSFLKNDVTEPWGYQNYFDGIFTSFALHELPGEKRIRVLDQSYLALKEKGRMVIVDFNPELSGVRRIILLSFFKPFEKENLNFLSFGQREMLKRVGFKGIKTFPVLAGILQISLALKE